MPINFAQNMLVYYEFVYFLTRTCMCVIVGLCMYIFHGKCQRHSNSCLMVSTNCDGHDYLLINYCDVYTRKVA